jgi:hypothetical protein
MSDAIFDSLLNNWFVISRRERTSDGQGGWEITYLSIGVVRAIRPPERRRRPGEAAADHARAV